MSGFPCPDCDKRTDVIDSRSSTEIRAAGRSIRMVNVRRRRRCAHCSLSFTTREVLDDLEPP